MLYDPVFCGGHRISRVVVLSNNTPSILEKLGFAAFTLKALMSLLPMNIQSSIVASPAGITMVPLSPVQFPNAP